MAVKFNRVLGAISGAVIGAIARFAVALAFIYYVSHWGGKWWNGVGEMWMAAFISALIGLPVGGLAGSTCKPLVGTMIGAALSGGSCLGLFVLPTEVMIGMSLPGGFDRIETLEVLAGLVAMILAGAAAGGIGATIGHRGSSVA